MEQQNTIPSNLITYRKLFKEKDIEGVLNTAELFLQEHMSDGRKAHQDATVLLAHVLQTRYEQVEAQKHAKLTPDQLETFLECLVRRAQDEPIDYIRGYCHFMNRRFVIDDSCMSPTPMTAQLVEKALSIIRSDNQELIIGDVGTGCGAIALSIALEVSVPLIATDISKDAIAVAKRNKERLGADEHLVFRCCDLIGAMIEEFTQNPHKFTHFILCANLPYHPENDWNLLEPTIRRYEPDLARRGGADGLLLYRRLFQMIAENRDVMPETISVVLEVDPTHSQNLTKSFQELFVDAEVFCSPGLDGIIDVLVYRIQDQRGQAAELR